MKLAVNEKTGAAIQAAIDAVSAAGGGTVSLEPGVYHSGTIRLRSHVELHLPAGSVIRGFEKPELYDDVPFPETVAPEGSRKALIAAVNCKDIAITGQGEINGAGPAFYDNNVPPDCFFAKPPHPRPRMIQLCHCENVILSGVTLKDSPGWTCWFVDCTDVHVSHIRIDGCQQMINNDGIDIDSCRRVTVSDSFFRTGDDCLILRAIRRSPEEPSICEDVVVSNCVLDSRCQGIRLGCPSDDTIRHCLFSNIVFRGRGTGIISENPARYLRRNCTGYLNMTDIRFQHIDITSGIAPIRINCENGIRLRKISGISFDDIRIDSEEPIRLLGNPETILENITLSRISGTVHGESPIETKYVRNLQIGDFNMTAETGVPVPLVRPAETSWETKF